MSSSLISTNSHKRADCKLLNDILGVQFKVLDDGFVRVVDYMGSDDAIVQAARVSYGEGTRPIHADRGLIRYLMRNHHTTPFEMCEIKFHVRVPMDVWRQWIRHRTANVNEYSTRYSIAIDSAHRTGVNEWRRQTTSNRQGSDEAISKDIGEKLSFDERDVQEHSRSIYKTRLEAGVAREQARKDLPLSTYTEAIWKIDLHNLFHFLQLRMDSHAQKEIRDYADVIGHEVVSKWCPLAWEAFCDYRLNALTLSSAETEILAALTTGKQKQALQIAGACWWLEKSAATLKENRERREFVAKLSRLGLSSLWEAMVKEV